MGRKPTIKDVAARAGVSYQTVSKVLNQRARVARATEQRIWEAARTLGYHPNWVARSLRSQRSQMIGYSWAPALAEQGNHFLEPFLQGMQLACEGTGYQVLTLPHNPGGDWGAGFRMLIDTRRVDGFVLSSVEYDDPRIQLLQECDFPFVAFGRSNPDWTIPCVDVDGAAGMSAVVEHLLARGHRKIAALALPENSRVGNNRMEGFQAALHRAAIQPAPEWIQRGEGTATFGLQAAARLLELPPDRRPTAIVAFNDFLAAGAGQAVQAKGLRVGLEIAITGFEDTPLARYASPSLTSARQPVLEIGQRVVTMLLERLDQGGILEPRVLCKPELIVRESSGLERV